MTLSTLYNIKHKLIVFSTVYCITRKFLYLSDVGHKQGHDFALSKLKMELIKKYFQFVYYIVISFLKRYCFTDNPLIDFKCSESAKFFFISEQTTYSRIKVLPTSKNAGIWYNHRRRMYTEEKAKVVAAVWGIEFIQFLAALAILH